MILRPISSVNTVSALDNSSHASALTCVGLSSAFSNLHMQCRLVGRLELRTHRVM